MQITFDKRLMGPGSSVRQTAPDLFIYLFISSIFVCVVIRETTVVSD